MFLLQRKLKQEARERKKEREMAAKKNNVKPESRGDSVNGCADQT